MGLGKVLFSKALDSLIINGNEMIISCRNEKECNSLRVMLYREREIYRRTVDGNIGRKLALTKCIINDKHCIRVYAPNDRLEELQCFSVEKGELIPLRETKTASEIERLIEVMRQDGVPEEEIEKTVASLQ